MERSSQLSNAALARQALARAHILPPAKQAELRRKVHKKFPSIGKAHAIAQALKKVA